MKSACQFRPVRPYLTIRETLDEFCAMQGKATKGKVTFLNVVNGGLF
jgi:hypothetical protein